MLFHSSLHKEMSRSFGATVVVLATVVMTMFLIRTVGLASRGSVDPAEVMMVLGYTVLGHAPTILTLSLFVAIVATMSRMYRDSEMTIWFASGKGLGSFVLPLVRFAWPIWLAIAVLVIFVWPWSNQQSQTLRDRYEQRGDLERVIPGQFQESASGDRVFFIDKDSVGGKTAGQVFIAANEKGKQIVTSARAGRIETMGPDRFLLLSNGQRLENETASPGFKISEFKEYGVLVDEKAQQDARALPPHVLSTRVLLAGGTAPFMGELSWRFGLALASINFVLIGLAFSAVNPRIGRNGNLLFAMFTFIAYYNLVNLGTSRISSATAEFWSFNIGLHGGIFGLTATLLAMKHWNFGLRLRARAPASKAPAASR
ncbi:MAG: LPS export ABC transporter permease LptF [Burkholderiaceae bacterium]|nr:LPS export ABC transporter permease LptF [Rhodoferax sp.]MCP5260318.1 LPS export ABC transporter permease LptF [Rhodoferax sp.]MCW5627320.1 LPS export ABC transporter permease LptF [Rhodoferax sp.]